jgi:hypothetical protein
MPTANLPESITTANIIARMAPMATSSNSHRALVRDRLLRVFELCERDF